MFNFQPIITKQQKHFEEPSTPVIIPIILNNEVFLLKEQSIRHITDTKLFELMRNNANPLFMMQMPLQSFNESIPFNLVIPNPASIPYENEPNFSNNVQFNIPTFPIDGINMNQNSFPFSYTKNTSTTALFYNQPHQKVLRSCDFHLQTEDIKPVVKYVNKSTFITSSLSDVIMEEPNETHASPKKPEAASQLIKEKKKSKDIGLF